MIEIGDVVIYRQKKYRVDNIKKSGNSHVLKVHSIRGKIQEIIYCLPIEYVKKV